MPTIHYLAYGSNLHPLRLLPRVPSARVVGVVEMPGYMLAFHKRSVDGSGKCLLYTEQGEPHGAHGVLYELDARDKPGLDVLEGNGNGYVQRLVQFPLKGNTYTPYLYIAQSTHIDPTLLPYDWYKQLVVAGARYHNLPDAYIASIEAVPSRPDPDPKRARENEELLKRIDNSWRGQLRGV